MPGWMSPWTLTLVCVPLTLPYHSSGPSRMSCDVSSPPSVQSPPAPEKCLVHILTHCVHLKIFNRYRDFFLNR